MKITPQEIHRQEFTRAMRGYAVEEVDAFLQRVADELERVVNDNAKLRDTVKTLEGQIAEYRRMEKNLERTLMTAQEAADTMSRAAEEKRDTVIRQAEVRAEEIVHQAQRRRDELRNELVNLQSQKRTMVAQLRALIDSQTRLLDDFELSGFDPTPGDQGDSLPDELDLNQP
ncbi:MAG: DivIVA domain-containing protein [Candidatus Coatesbacteria bacterium]|nr:DivIVA domain-containing protein [Candidatus Coatesbacteria bacterium]